MSERETVRMSKRGVKSAALATGLWADMLSFTHKRMERLDTDQYDISIQVVISDATNESEGPSVNEMLFSDPGVARTTVKREEESDGDN